MRLAIHAGAITGSCLAGAGAVGGLALALGSAGFAAGFFTATFLADGFAAAFGAAALSAGFLANTFVTAGLAAAFGAAACRVGFFAATFLAAGFAANVTDVLAGTFLAADCLATTVLFPVTTAPQEYFVRKAFTTRSSLGKSLRPVASKLNGFFGMIISSLGSLNVGTRTSKRYVNGTQKRCAHFASSDCADTSDNCFAEFLSDRLSSVV